MNSLAITTTDGADSVFVSHSTIKGSAATISTGNNDDGVTIGTTTVRGGRPSAPGKATTTSSSPSPA